MSVIPGEVLVAATPLEINAGAPVTTLLVLNTADRPIQVGSHLHFAEANDGLQVDREAAWGQRLDIPAGTATRFEPGIEREVDLVPIAGERRVPGIRGLAGGKLDR